MTIKVCAELIIYAESDLDADLILRSLGAAGNPAKVHVIETSRELTRP